MSIGECSAYNSRFCIINRFYNVNHMVNKTFLCIYFYFYIIFFIRKFYVKYSLFKYYTLV
jgi:hypothetical protein